MGVGETFEAMETAIEVGRSVELLRHSHADVAAGVRSRKWGFFPHINNGICEISAASKLVLEGMRRRKGLLPTNWDAFPWSS